MNSAHFMCLLLPKSISFSVKYLLIFSLKFVELRKIFTNSGFKFLGNKMYFKCFLPAYNFSVAYQGIHNSRRLCLQWSQIDSSFMKIIDWMFSCSKLLCWNLGLDGMVFGGETFGRWLLYEGGVLTNEVHVPLKETGNPSPNSFGVKTEKVICESGNAFWIWHWICWNLGLSVLNLLICEKWISVLYWVFFYFLGTAA